MFCALPDSAPTRELRGGWRPRKSLALSLRSSSRIPAGPKPRSDNQGSQRRRVARQVFLMSLMFGVRSGSPAIKRAILNKSCGGPLISRLEWVPASVGECRKGRGTPPPCFLLLVRGQLRPAAEFHTARLRSLAAFGCALPDQVTFELCKAAKHGQHQPPVRCRGVRAHASPKDRKPVLRSVMAARVFSRSRVDRASRSSRVTVSTSPASSAAITRRSVQAARSAYPVHLCQLTRLMAGGFQRPFATCGFGA
jgi:hypothetical protein